MIMLEYIIFCRVTVVAKQRRQYSIVENCLIETSERFRLISKNEYFAA